MEKLDYWSLVNFLLLKQNTLTYSCLTDTKLHVHVVNSKITLSKNCLPADKALGWVHTVTYISIFLYFYKTIFLYFWGNILIFVCVLDFKFWGIFSCHRILHMNITQFAARQLKYFFPNSSHLVKKVIIYKVNGSKRFHPRPRINRPRTNLTSLPFHSCQWGFHRYIFDLKKQ